MCVPVCMFVFTRTVLFPSRWCVVMSVTSMDANCGQVGIRSPQGCVRSTSFIAPLTAPRSVAAPSVGELLLAKLEDDAVREREVDDLVVRDGLVDLLVIEKALHRSLDVLPHHHLVLRPGLPGLERLVCRLHHVAVLLRLADGHVQDARAQRRV